MMYVTTVYVLVVSPVCIVRLSISVRIGHRKVGVVGVDDEEPGVDGVCGAFVDVEFDVVGG